MKLTTQAYCKMVLHGAKYPHCAVNGLLVAEKQKPRKEHLPLSGPGAHHTLFVDCIPLFHGTLALAPMLEVALSLVSAGSAAEERGFPAAGAAARDGARRGAAGGAGAVAGALRGASGGGSWSLLRARGLFRNKPPPPGAAAPQLCLRDVDAGARFPRSVPEHVQVCRGCRRRGSGDLSTPQPRTRDTSRRVAWVGPRSSSACGECPRPRCGLSHAAPWG